MYYSAVANVSSSKWYVEEIRFSSDFQQLIRDGVNLLNTTQSLSGSNYSCWFGTAPAYDALMNLKVDWVVVGKYDPTYKNYTIGLEKTPSNISNIYLTLTKLVDSVYTYYGWANDSAGYSSYVSGFDSSSSRFLRVDVSGPIVSIYSTRSKGYNVSLVDLNYSVYDLMSNVDSCWYFLNGGSSQILDCFSEGYD